MALFTPWNWGEPEVVWQAAMGDDAVAALVDSPLRRDVARAILDGASAAIVIELPPGRNLQDPVWRLSCSVCKSCRN